MVHTPFSCSGTTFRVTTILLGCVCAALDAPTQEPASDSEKTPAPELVTDRPDQTESSVVIPRGYVQIETGGTYTNDGSATRTLEYPSTLIRVGLANRLELRLGTTGLVTEFVGENTTGYGDFELGLKIYFWSEEGWRPETALLIGTSIPSGNNNFSTGRFDPAFRFAFSHTLSDRVSLGYNLGMAWESEPRSSTPPGGRVTLSQIQYTITSGIGITDKLGTYFEFFGDIPASAHGQSAHSFSNGFTYLLRPNVQLDLSSGVGITKAAPDWTVGAGISLRFPR